MKFKNDHPSVEFEVTGGSSEGVLTALREGQVDVALVAGANDLDVHFHTITLLDERLVVVVSPNHPFAAKNAVSVDDLDGQAYIHQSHCQIFESMSQVMGARDVELKKVLSSGRDDWVQEMVRAGMGFAVMPELSVTDPRLVVRRLIEPETVRTVVLATARGRPHSPAVGAFVSAARAVRGPRGEAPETRDLAFVPAGRAPRLRLVQATA